MKVQTPDTLGAILDIIFHNLDKDIISALKLNFEVLFKEEVFYFLKDCHKPAKGFTEILKKLDNADVVVIKDIMAWG